MLSAYGEGHRRCSSGVMLRSFFGGTRAPAKTPAPGYTDASRTSPVAGDALAPSLSKKYPPAGRGTAHDGLGPQRPPGGAP